MYSLKTKEQVLKRVLLGYTVSKQEADRVFEAGTQLKTKIENCVVYRLAVRPDVNAPIVAVYSGFKNRSPVTLAVINGGKK